MFLERRPPTAADYHYRGAERVAATIQATLIDTCGAARLVWLRDISSLGFMAECDGFLGIGSIVTLRVTGLPPLRAEIRWALADWIGCRFDRELDAPTVALLTGAPEGVARPV